MKIYCIRLKIMVVPQTVRLPYLVLDGISEVNTKRGWESKTVECLHVVSD